MKDKIIDEIIIQKNSLVENLTQNEKKEIDIYLESILKEINPIMEVFDKITLDEEFRKNIAESFKSEIEEQKWLEKLSKTFYDQVDIQDQMKIQKE